MESNGIIQTELDQTTTDLLLQESIQTNQKLEELKDLLILVRDMRIILPESIKHVLFEQMKKLQDLQENSLIQSKEELQQSKEQHLMQMNEFSRKIEEYQKKTENQLSKLKKENQEDIVAKCCKLFADAETKISGAVESTSVEFKKATKAAGKMICKNLLFSFVTSMILVAAAVGGCLYVQNYRDGTKIAEAKAVEALAAERAKFEAEITEKKKQIEQNAIATYKNSDIYREDACKLVATNISKLDCLHYMYIYIKSEDINKYSEVKSFYKNFLVEGQKEYKKKYK